MNATHRVSQERSLAQVISIRKNRPPQGAIFTLRFSGAQADDTQPRPPARASDSPAYRTKRAGIEGCGPDLFFAEWDFVD